MRSEKPTGVMAADVYVPLEGSKALPAFNQRLKQTGAKYDGVRAWPSDTVAVSHAASCKNELVTPGPKGQNSE